MGFCFQKNVLDLLNGRSYLKQKIKKCSNTLGKCSLYKAYFFENIIKNEGTNIAFS